MVFVMVFFGRDDYDTKIIVYETDKAICCTYLDEKYNGILVTANFKSREKKQEYIDSWSVKYEND